MLSGCQLLPGAEFYVAIDDKGLWPNLKRLANGELGAVIYNHPSHGIGPDSDIELWVSADEGRSWLFRSKISSHPEDQRGIRMNHAFGLNAEGELIVLVSGYHEGQRTPCLPTQCCLSSDNGFTWERSHADVVAIPFGDIFITESGLLACPAYRIFKTSGSGKTSVASLHFSDDCGKTWGKTRQIAEFINEVHVLRLKSGTWLATARTDCVDRMDNMLPHGNGQVLYRSVDEGCTWQGPKPISPQGQENAHLLELADGRILCAFTSRIPGLFGVVLRMSADQGQTWSSAVPLLTIPGTDWFRTDCGYPSSVQLEDGTIATACYFGTRNQKETPGHVTPWHQRYHMGVARWKASSLPLSTC